jgi:hypothetical protein
MAEGKVSEQLAETPDPVFLFTVFSWAQGAYRFADLPGLVWKFCSQ